MKELLIRVEGIVHYRNAPYLQDGIVRSHTLDRIGKDDRNTIPLPDSQIQQAFRKAIHRILQLSESKLAPEKVHRRVVGKIAGRPL
jgi:hypothetical protein